ncbi:PHB depolymerase family esterase [Variovorax sp. J31P179]|uniref:extracellular catalytic domain type 1 short-chain-length polyhydroxyalkanoate depolymerase n=1 Tax=Variovorax sp. J31P179 TaxID=3053508 RepID=UPI00257681AA|nr:PHB depolymerase family esterase [Variovorax sp. J31P179]MDM0079276.1 PHB depolymerase family esterase [Variovorax sp. J31P179]
MARRKGAGGWLGVVARGMEAITRSTVRAGTRAVGQTVKPVIEKRRPPAGAGQWIQGLAMGATGMRRFRLYRPPGIKFGERLPLMVMLHGCGQDAKTFATSTRMNLIAARERFLVLYPEQDRVSNPQGCWNWFDTSSGRAYGEAALIMKAIDQVCLMYAVDRTRIAVAGLSAGASMAALLVARHPDRFAAVVMHSGIPPGTAHSTLSALGAMHGHRSTKPLAAPPLARAAAGWPPLMVIHGAGDRVVAASNGLAAVRAWADAMGATSSKERTLQRGKRYPATVTDFKHGASTVATLVEIDRLGHAWSGGAAGQPYSDGAGPDASRMAWAFAARQFGARHAAARHYISSRQH